MRAQTWIEWARPHPQLLPAVLSLVLTSEESVLSDLLLPAVSVAVVHAISIVHTLLVA